MKKRTERMLFRKKTDMVRLSLLKMRIQALRHKKKRNDKMIKNGEAGRHTDDNHKQSSGKTVITQLYRCFLKINPYFVLLITVKR